MDMKIERVAGDTIDLTVLPDRSRDLLEFLEFCRATDPVQTIDIVQDGNTFPDELEDLILVFSKNPASCSFSMSKWQVLKINSLLRAFIELGQSVEFHGGSLSDERLKELQAKFAAIRHQLFARVEGETP